MKRIKKAKLVAAIALATTLPMGNAFAQETSSSINGTIVDSEGNVLSGATVIVIHEPTGQRKTLTTNESGRYSARGLRVGGPYSIEVTRDGYSEAEEDDVYIQLGEDRAINAVLVQDAIALDTVKAVGVAAQSATFNPDNMGTGTVVTSAQIEEFASTNRSLSDFTRLDSRVQSGSNGSTGEDNGSFAAAGVNNRYNNISIDGVSTNDEFGLEPTGQPGLSQTFSLDTIDELNVQLSPYDTALSNFVGLNVNAVTKSGTNYFTGRLSGYYQNEDMAKSGLNDYTDETYSLSLGGPIIKDKLFFFVNYENKERVDVADDTIASNISGENYANVLEAARIAQEVWGIDVGEQLSQGTDTQQKILVKLDWNINDYHRASFRYNRSEDEDYNLRHQGRFDTAFTSHYYRNDFENTNYSGILYSDWTSNFSTEFRLVNNEFYKAPKTFSNTPQVRIRLGRDDIYLGTEQNRHSNTLAVDTLTGFFAGEYFANSHTFKFGVDYKGKDTDNLYIRDNNGSYEFRSLEDFAAGDYSRFNLQVSNDPNDPTPSADWSMSQIGFFAQDNWTVTDRLTLMYGFRYDKPDVKDRPALNQTFVDAFGVPNNDVLREGVFQPRIGFNFDMSDELYLQLRGGVGLFAGSTPDVWLSNSFTNNGVSLSAYQDFNDLATFSPDPNNQPTPGSIGRANVDYMDPNFEYPSSWKANLAVDAELPWFGLIASTELTYSKVKSEVFYTHENLGEPVDFLPDGRAVYSRGNNANENFIDVIKLSNTDKGDVKTATFSLEKPMSEHWHATASYTYTDANDVSSATSSQAISNWRFRPVYNANEEVMATSNFEIENSFVGTLRYQNNFFGDTLTKVSLVFTSRDGNPFSYVYNNDVNNEGNFGDNDLVYVPNQGEYVLTDPSLQDDFEAFLASTGLAAYRGQIAPRNAFKAPRQNRWDLRVQQELPAWGPVRATMFFDVRNIGNLLNSDWGGVEYVPFGTSNIIGDLEEIDDQGRYVLDWDGDTNPFSTANFSSRWSAQLGFRLDW